MSILLWIISISIVICLYVLRWRQSRKNLYKCAEKIPGPEGYPVLGLIPYFIGKTNDEIFATIWEVLNPDGKLAKIWFGPVFAVMIENPDYLKIILNSDNCLDKAFPYKFLGVNLGLIAAPCK